MGILLIASVANGVEEVEEIDSKEVMVLPVEDFYSSLDTLSEDTVIGCEANKKWVDKIHAEYGVH